jgi:hypothetical protein
VSAATILRVAEGPAAVFCAATTFSDGLCREGLRPDGTCPAQARHNRVRLSRDGAVFYRPGAAYWPRRMEAPAPIYREPLCPLCDQPVYFDGDGFSCDRCSFSWPTNHNEPGETRDGGERQCDATTVRHGDTYRCLLTEDHGTVSTGEVFSFTTYRFEDRKKHVHRGVRVGVDGYPPPHWRDEVGIEWPDEESVSVPAPRALPDPTPTRRTAPRPVPRVVTAHTGSAL